MRAAFYVFLFPQILSITGEDSDEGGSGLSLSFSKKSVKGHVETPDDSEEHIHESTTKTVLSKSEDEKHRPRDDTSNAVGQSTKGENGEDSTSSSTATTDRDSVQSVDDASTRSFAIVHQTELFLGNLRTVSFTMTELSLEAINASVHIRALSSYTELLIKSLEHFETLKSEEQRFYWQLKDTVNELTDYITKDELEQAGRADPHEKHQTVVETLEVSEDTVSKPVKRTMVEGGLSSLQKAKSKIQEKVEKKLGEHVGGSGSPKERSLIEVGLQSPLNVRNKIKAKYGNKANQENDSLPAGRSLMEVGLGGVVREQMQRTETTRVVRRDPRPTKQVHKSTNININIKGILKKVKEASGDSGSSQHHHETHLHQQQFVHHHPAPVYHHAPVCIPCMHMHR